MRTDPAFQVQPNIMLNSNTQPSKGIYQSRPVNQIKFLQQL
jgi:hypothetical protein